MNEILRDTHAVSNINILKARDVYFDKARNRNKWYKLTIVIPPVVAGLTYLPFITRSLPFVDSLRDFIIGICTIIFVIAGELILSKNAADLTISNALREEYDLSVFGLPRNELAFSKDLLRTPDGEWKEEIINAWESRPDTDKYEVWYEEFFSDTKRNNVLCFQMDNIIYTVHIYKELKESLKRKMYASGVAIAILLLLSIFLWKNIRIFILILFSLFGAIQALLGDYKNVKDLMADNENVVSYIANNSESIKQKLQDEKDSAVFLRTVQDLALNNREKSMFVPKKIRDKYLKSGNPFYKDLDKIKNKYMEDPYIPDEAAKIDVLSGETEEVTTTLDKVHDRLLSMLIDTDNAFREAGIRYFLDGGSLIGTCRDEHGFIFWDDDVDIALMAEDIEKAKEVIREKLGDKYAIQDYSSDPYYSPRLSNFRIRERNDKSILEEKDSELYEAYENRGLFIDVYAYAPIVINKTIDKLVRRLLIQGFSFRIRDSKKYKYNCRILKGLYTRIRGEETKWKHDSANRKAHFNRYSKLKAKYLKRVDRYLKMAKNKDYYAYIPNYIDDLYKPGPYIRAEALANIKESDFENVRVPVPEGFDEILTAYYDDWQKKPFSGIEDFITKDGYEFSKKKINVTSLKHIKYINYI